MDLVVADDRLGQRPALPEDELSCLLKPVVAVAGIPVVDENPVGDTARFEQLTDGACGRVKAHRCG